MTQLSSYDLRLMVKKSASENNAAIFAHYYQDDEVQEVADFIGDSLQLASIRSECEKVIFCGVRFMAETYKVLNPDKRVFVPDLDAGCSLVDSCPPSQFAAFRSAYPDRVAVVYVNSSLEVKAIADVCVTSSSAEKIINYYPEDVKFLFAPDLHLGNYLKKRTGRDIISWPGSCLVHERFSDENLRKLRRDVPNALVLAHPECPERFLETADFIGSTSQLIEYVADRNGGSFIVLTEPGIINKMHELSPKSFFYPVTAKGNESCEFCNKCPYMRLNSLEKIYDCINYFKNEISIDLSLATRAHSSIRKMVEILAVGGS